MNSCHFIGNLGGDPDMRSTGAGIAVCTFSIAVSRNYKDSSGNYPVDWIRVVAWKQLAELCDKYLVKGNKVAVIGTLQCRQYEDKNGQKRTEYEVVANNIEFLTPRNSDKQGDSGYRNNAPETGAPEVGAPDDYGLPF